MPMAVKVLDLAAVPLWAVWTFALMGFSSALGVLLWIAPARLRPGILPALLAPGVFCLRAALADDSRTLLWFGGLFGFSCLALLVMPWPSFW